MSPKMDREEGRGGELTPISGQQLPSTELRTPYPDFEDSFNLRDYLEPLFRRKWTIVICTLAVVIPTLIYTVTRDPIYKAVGWVELSPSAPKVTKFEDVVAGPFKGGADQFTQTQMELLQSGALARRVSDRLGLEQHATFRRWSGLEREEPGVIKTVFSSIVGFPGSLLRTFRSWFEPPREAVFAGVNEEVQKLRLQRSLEGFVRSGLSIEPRQGTSIISIGYDSTDPALARDVVNMLIDEFMNWEMDRRIEAAGAAKQQLDKQISLARTQLETAEGEVVRYAREAGIVSLDSRLNEVFHQLEQINAALARVGTERITKGEHLGVAERSDLSSSPLVMQNELVQNLKNQYIGLMAEYERLRVVFKDDYPSVRTLRAQMLDIGSKINMEQERILNSLKQEYESVLKTERALKTSAEEKKALAMQLNELAGTYKTLEREVEINKQIYHSLLERSKEIDATVGTDLGNVRVVDLATIPLRPYKPNLNRNLFLAMVLGLMGGIGLALVREYMDSTIKRVDEISDRHWIPVLGVVPVAEKGETKDLDSLVRVKPLALFSEAVRVVKVSIQLSHPGAGPQRSLLVTSTTAGEGKSTISANLAQAFAGAREKVLLIDADLRKPRLHRLLGSNGNSTGLSTYLSGVSKLENVIQKTDVPNLYFIPSGPTPLNPSELFASGGMKNLMDNLGKHFDRIILDAPPFGVFSEVLRMGSQVDGVILITALGSTHHEALRVFRKSLVKTNGQIIGAVVNKFKINRFADGYYHRSYGRDYYNYTGREDKLPAVVEGETKPESRRNPD